MIGFLLVEDFAELRIEDWKLWKIAVLDLWYSAVVTHVRLIDWLYLADTHPVYHLFFIIKQA